MSVSIFSSIFAFELLHNIEASALEYVLIVFSAITASSQLEEKPGEELVNAVTYRRVASVVKSSDQKTFRLFKSTSWFILRSNPPLLLSSRTYLPGKEWKSSIQVQKTPNVKNWTTRLNAQAKEQSLQKYRHWAEDQGENRSSLVNLPSRDGFLLWLPQGSIANVTISLVLSLWKI